MRVWRITAARYASRAFDGEGARLFGGRWNRRGTPVVYAAEHLSLAVLEQLVHLNPARTPKVRVQLWADVPDDLARTELGPAELPADWRTVEGHPGLAGLGSEWAAAGETAVLVVPSVVLPSERNVVLNPDHPDFARIEAGSPEVFEFDPRLLT